MKRLFGVTVLTALFAAGMTACGGAETGGENGGETGGEAGGSTEVTVTTLDSFVFDPADVTAGAGAEVAITLDNTGQALEHSWVVLNAGLTEDDALTIQDEGDEDKKFFEARVPPGETATSTFTAPAEAGTYVVVCAVPGHAAGGMLGTLTVE